MKARVMIGFATLFAISVAAVAANKEEEKIDIEDIKCAMNLKGPAKDVAGSSIDYKGGRLFFCCDNCPKAFTKGLEDDDKKDQLAAQGNFQLVATKQATSTGRCPLTKRAVNPKHKVKIAGVEVGVCCGGCKAKVSKEEDVNKQIAMVFNEKAFKNGFETPKDKKEKDE